MREGLYIAEVTRGLCSFQQITVALLLLGAGQVFIERGL